MLLHRALGVALAIAVALLMLVLEFDKPLGDPEHVDAVVIGCYKPTGRSASRTHVKCTVEFGAVQRNLWSRELRNPSSRVTVLRYQRRYSGLSYYELDDR